MPAVYDTLADVPFRLDDCAAMPRPNRVLLTTPTHYDIQYVINPHMTDHIGSVDRNAALQQWKALRAVYTALDVDPVVVEGHPGLPDMVFCANQTLPFCRPSTGASGVILSRMHAEQRRDEVQHYADVFRERGEEVHALPDDLDGDFEGMGDAIWHPGRQLLWGGHGFRTSRDVYRHLAEALGVDVLLMSLSDPDFYHLDTCFSVLDEHSVLIYPGAFDDDGRALIEHFFSTIIEAPEDEARNQFACNAHCPDGQHVLIQEGCTTTEERLRGESFVPVPLDTSEFLKSGGSVFCMKQMIW